MNFNLIDDDWIPCLRRVGEKPQLMSLRQTLLQAHTLREIYADSPLTTSAIYRLCIAVLHSIFRGPQNPKEWHKLWKNQKWRSEEVDPYLNKYLLKFDLFGEKPFWQVHASALAQDKAAMFLLMGVDQNMGTLFDHRTAAAASPLNLAEAAQALVTTQTFALGGGVSEVGGNFTDAPWARGIIFFAEGDNLFETLALNLMRYPDEQAFPYQTTDDRPVWERDEPFQREANVPRGVLDYLTWPSRRVRFIPPNESKPEQVDWIRISQGLEFPKDLRDGMKRIQDIKKPQKNKPSFAPLKFEVGRALWRDSGTLFDWRDPTIRRPQVCNWLSDLVDILGSYRRLRLMAFGMATDQASIVFTRAERLPLPIMLLYNGELIGRLGEGLGMAEGAGKALHRALRTLAAGMLISENEARQNAEKRESSQAMKRLQKTEGTDEGGSKSDEKFDKMVTSWGVEGIYWDALELHFGNFINSLADAGDGDELYAATAEWQRCVRNAAIEALDRAEDYAGENARALRATVAARGQLFGWFKQHLPKDSPTFEETKND